MISLDKITVIYSKLYITNKSSKESIQGTNLHKYKRTNEYKHQYGQT